MRATGAALTLSCALLAACAGAPPTPSPTATQPGATATATESLTPTPWTAVTNQPVTTQPPTPSPGPTQPAAASPSVAPTPTDEPSANPTPLPEPTVSAAPTGTDVTGWSAAVRVSERLYGDVAMVVGPAGEIHAAGGPAEDWESQDGSGIFYLTNAGGGWTETRVSSSPSGGADVQPAIALLADGSVAIAFTRYGRVRCEFGCNLGRNRGIHLVHNLDGAWSEPTPISPTGSHSPQLASAGGWLHLLYDTFAEVPRTFYERGAGIALAPAYSVEAASARLALDGQGSAHLAYVAVQPRDYDGPAPVFHWSLPLRGQSQATVAAEMDGAVEVRSLAFRPDGHPVIALTVNDWSAYPDYRTDYLLSRDSEGWGNPQEVPELAGSLAVDGAGSWHGLQDVSRADEDAGGFPRLTQRDGLWYLTGRGGTVTRERIDASVRRAVIADAEDSAASALAVGVEGRPHVLFTRLVKQDHSIRPFGRDGLWYMVGPGG